MLPSSSCLGVGSLHPMTAEGADIHNGDFSFVVRSMENGQRLDHVITARFPEYSRSYLVGLIHEARILVDGLPQRPSRRLKMGETVTGILLPPVKSLDIVPEKVDFVILWEDEHLLVLSKPPGIVVHPAAGNFSGTLTHGLLFHDMNIAAAGERDRPGIVHRLDKDTSGIMVVARNQATLRQLCSQFKDRLVKKIYRAIVVGVPRQPEGRIDAPIGRHPVDRKKMAVRAEEGRTALTSWKVLESFAHAYAHVELAPETGRTHQIRVHMAHLGHPLAGDVVYGQKTNDRSLFARQMLHASTLSFFHPASGERLRFSAPLWPDFSEALAKLRQLGEKSCAAG